MTPRTPLARMAELTGTDAAELEKTAERYPFAVSNFLRRRLEEGTYSHRALKQFLPDIRELTDVPGFVPDPTGENNLRPVPSVVRCYENRLALTITFTCLVYCRFCFRKSLVGFPESKVSEDELSAGVDYIRTHPEISDVLLTGGDPLAMPNHRLLPLLRELDAIEHLRVIRLNSRALNTAPERFNDELLDFLRRSGKFWYYAHINHPDDIDHPEVLEAVGRLLDARVPILNQCVFLAGVNDDVETMMRLMTLCYYNKVIPYNLYVLDHVEGGAHFEVPKAKVIEIYKAMAKLHGPAQPLLVYVGTDNRKRRATNCDQLSLDDFLSSRPEVSK
jgi:KamA family protein